MTPIVLVIAIGAAWIAWILAAPLLQRRRRRKLAAGRFPPEWDAILQRDLPAYVRLPVAFRRRLQALVRIFLSEKPILGCAGLQVTDAMRLNIAAQACLLILNRDFSDYDALAAVLVYPGGFISPHRRRDEAGVLIEEDRALAGESWDTGKVVLSWDDVRAGSRDAGDGNNVVFHEFAHQLDQADGGANGAPRLQSRAARERWAEVWAHAFEDVRARLRHGEHALLRSDAVEDPAEFFAVATEYFFEAPRALKRELPDLYAQLQGYYRVDPSEWD